MQKAEILTSIVLSAHALARVAAQESGNEAPSAQWRALSILSRHDGLRLGELATAARTTQPGMTRLIGTLEHDGLVRRSPDPLDSRATLVSATERGIHAVTAWRRQLGQTLSERFADLDIDDWGTLQRAAEILATHSREPQDDTSATGGHE